MHKYSNRVFWYRYSLNGVYKKATILSFKLYQGNSITDLYKMFAKWHDRLETPGAIDAINPAIYILIKHGDVMPLELVPLLWPFVASMLLQASYIISKLSANWN